MRDKCLLKECRTIPFRIDQFIELLDLIADLDGESIGLEFASVTNGFHTVEPSSDHSSSIQHGVSANASSHHYPEKLLPKDGPAIHSAFEAIRCPVERSLKCSSLTNRERITTDPAHGQDNLVFW